MEEMKNTFERVYCTTLKSRTDRQQAFEKNLSEHDWPFLPPVFVEGVVGNRTGYPAWWKGPGRGAWGCYRSHLRLIEQCLSDGVQSVLLMEDDAYIEENFSLDVAKFLSHLPDDWESIYLGGECLKHNIAQPARVNEYVLRPYNVNRTHAWALRGEGLRKVYLHLTDPKGWGAGMHIDHRLGQLHEQRRINVYCPWKWLVGQRGGRSDVQPKRQFPRRMWVDPGEIANADPAAQPFVAVLGLHSSGSSCLAGVLYHLGVHMGNNLRGYYGKNPSKQCGFEADGLIKFCEAALPFPSAEFRQPVAKRTAALKHWINPRRREAANMRTVAGGKYPQLCAMGDELIDICGDRLHVVFSNRPIEESIESMVRRCPHLPQEQIERHQRMLEEGKQYVRQTVPEERILEADYHSLLSATAHEVERIAAFLPINPSDENKRRATAYVDPSKRHVFSGESTDEETHGRQNEEAFASDP